MRRFVAALVATVSLSSTLEAGTISYTFDGALTAEKYCICDGFSNVTVGRTTITYINPVLVKTPPQMLRSIKAEDGTLPEWYHRWTGNVVLNIELDGQTFFGVGTGRGLLGFDGRTDFETHVGGSGTGRIDASTFFDFAIDRSDYNYIDANYMRGNSASFDFYARDDWEASYGYSINIFDALARVSYQVQLLPEMHVLASVPLPATASLIAIALSALAALRTRRNTRARTPAFVSWFNRPCGGALRTTSLAAE